MDNIWKCWDEHYKSIGIKSNRICKDGIINLNHYNTANKKLLFVLKEVNDWEGGDIRKMLENGPKYQPWYAISRWASGIFRNFPDYKEIDNFTTMCDSIRKIAAINLKKTSGGSVSNMAVINAYTHIDESLLLRQISNINPDYIISGGVFSELIWLLDLKVNPDNPIAKPVLDKIRNAWIISFRHPTRVNNSETYLELKDIFKNNPEMN